VSGSRLRWGTPVRRVAACGRPGGLRLGFTLSRGMRVGLFGGSFNPAHQGHGHVAATAMKRLHLDRLIWLVSPQNPLKSGRETAPLGARMASASTSRIRAGGTGSGLKPRMLRRPCTTSS